jgi:hypothetical protein
MRVRQSDRPRQILARGRGDVLKLFRRRVTLRRSLLEDSDGVTIAVLAIVYVGLLKSHFERRQQNDLGHA